MISTQKTPNLCCFKRKLSHSWGSKTCQANKCPNLPNRACTQFPEAERIPSSYTLLPQKDKQKLFGYKNFYLSYYVCVKTYSRHHVDRKYHCINKFHKLSHIGLFAKWKKYSCQIENCLRNLFLRFWSSFRTKSCSLKYIFILLFEVFGAISTTAKAESSEQPFSAMKYQLWELQRWRYQ